MSSQRILPATPKKPKFSNWILLLAASLLIWQFFLPKPNEDKTLPANTAPITLTAKSEFVQGQDVVINVKNNSDKPITIESNCPSNPLIVYKFTGNQYEETKAETKFNCQFLTETVVESGSQKPINYTYWNHALFNELGRYKVGFVYNEVTLESSEFTITAPGFVRNIGRNFFYIPIYNALVFLISVAPYSSLGFAIIILTLILRLILLVPSQKAINSQRRMQLLQPKLAAIRKKYEGNQERIAKETMNLWKEHKVNPLGSCLPLIIQFPILISLYYVILNGLNPDNAYIIYSYLQNVDLSNISTNFLGILELMKPNRYVLPLIVGGLQFFQMKLTMASKKTSDKDSGKKELGSEMETVNKSMTYVLPIMIAVFTATAPAGVGLYWATSTVFGIAQQVVANRKI